MKKFYIISNNFRNDVVQLKSNKLYSEIEPYLNQYSTEKLPNDVVFSIAKGKKWADLLYYHEAASIIFLSQKVIDVLSAIINMKDMCYPIKIDTENTSSYYVLYNKAAYEFINPNYMLDDFDEPPYIYIPDEEYETPRLFTHVKGIFNIVDEEIMQALRKHKVTNIYFREIYSLDSNEYQELLYQHSQHKAFLP